MIAAWPNMWWRSHAIVRQVAKNSGTCGAHGSGVTRSATAAASTQASPRGCTVTCPPGAVSQQATGMAHSTQAGICAPVNAPMFAGGLAAAAAGVGAARFPGLQEKVEELTARKARNDTNSLHDRAVHLEAGVLPLAAAGSAAAGSPNASASLLSSFREAAAESKGRFAVLGATLAGLCYVASETIRERAERENAQRDFAATGAAFRRQFSRSFSRQFSEQQKMNTSSLPPSPENTESTSTDYLPGRAKAALFRKSRPKVYGSLGQGRKYTCVVEYETADEVDPSVSAAGASVSLLHQNSHISKEGQLAHQQPHQGAWHGAVSDTGRFARSNSFTLEQSTDCPGSFGSVPERTGIGQGQGNQPVRRSDRYAQDTKVLTRQNSNSRSSWYSAAQLRDDKSSSPGSGVKKESSRKRLEFQVHDTSTSASAKIPGLLERTASAGGDGSGSGSGGAANRSPYDHRQRAIEKTKEKIICGQL